MKLVTSSTYCTRKKRSLLLLLFVLFSLLYSGFFRSWVVVRHDRCPPPRSSMCFQAEIEAPPVCMSFTCRPAAAESACQGAAFCLETRRGKGEWEGEPSTKNNELGKKSLPNLSLTTNRPGPYTHASTSMPGICQADGRAVCFLPPSCDSCVYMFCCCVRARARPLHRVASSTALMSQNPSSFLSVISFLTQLLCRSSGAKDATFVATISISLSVFSIAVVVIRWSILHFNTNRPSGVGQTWKWGP